MSRNRIHAESRIGQRFGFCGVDLKTPKYPKSQNDGLYPKIKGLWTIVLGTLEVHAVLEPYPGLLIGGLSKVSLQKPITILAFQL